MAHSPAPDTATPPKVYISYSHRDAKFADELAEILQPLVEREAITVFYDRFIQAGTEWNAELARHLDSAAIVLFLVSPDSLRSKGVEFEIARATERPESVRIIPIIVRACDWRHSVLARFQMLPRDLEPLAGRKDRKKVLAAIVKDIERLAGSMKRQDGAAVLPRHTSAIRRVVFTPDGGRAITASDDHTARVWDLSTLQPIAVLGGHGGAVVDVDVSQDGRSVVTASTDGGIKLWHLSPATGAFEPRTLRDRGLPVVAVAFQGDRVVVALRDSSVQEAELEHSRAVVLVPPRETPIGDLAVGADGTIVSVYKDGRCRATRSAGGKHDWSEFRVATSPMVEVKPLGDGSHYVSCCETGAIQIFDLTGSVREFGVAPGRISSLAPLPGGRHVVAASDDGMLRLCDVATGRVVRESFVGADRPTAVGVTADGKRAIWGSVNGGLFVWPVDVSAQQPLPEGRDRIRLAYLAVLELPELWRVLETFDEGTLAGLRAQLSVPPEADLLQFLEARHPNVEPPPLWTAWVEASRRSWIDPAARH